MQTTLLKQWITWTCYQRMDRQLAHAISFRVGSTSSIRRSLPDLVYSNHLHWYGQIHGKHVESVQPTTQTASLLTETPCHSVTEPFLCCRALHPWRQLEPCRRSSPHSTFLPRLGYPKSLASKDKCGPWPNKLLNQLRTTEATEHSQTFVRPGLYRWPQQQQQGTERMELARQGQR